MQRKPVRSAARHAFTVIAVPVALVIAAAGAARAEVPHPPIVLALDPCADVDAKEVRRLVPIEMGAPVPVVGGEGDAGDTTRVTVGCVVDSPSLVRLEVRDPTTGRILDRFITLLGVPRTDQARLVAIAAVELVAASRGQGGDVARLADQGVKPAASELVVTAAPAPAPAERRWRLGAVASLRHFGGLPDPVPGGGLTLQHVRRRLVVGADFVAEGLTQSTALGTVDCLLVSGSVVAAARLPLGRLAFEGGAGARGGYARLVGHGGAAVTPVVGGAVSAPWIGPLGTLRAVLALPRGFALALGGELGWATAGVVGRVEGSPDLSVRGTWWGATLGAAYAY